ncbi:glycoside hydrolase family 31 protein [Microbacterium sp. QXD-8]|uniref:Glycoside hydrolase family 31 protein n=1 Tax=Microbacterium psychrotolerans TaxID=3068321 RepID=A0ABU0YW36_9MICO|nr:TIM-barrel domain-containing protein [Microbacterium sp. QXD-8]MDQ7876527.1 glycoside hydrolase family 31 protein [Microbacterium sp. QXD-8]
MHSSTIVRQLRVESAPHAHPDAIVRGDRWRLTVLADGLIRAEWSEEGRFEDRATTFAIRREMAVPEFRVIDGGDEVEIVTSRFHLRYDRGPFTPHGLSVRPLGVGRGLAEWRFGDGGDLGGTARTLDTADGRIPVQGGVVSRAGVAAIDDSTSFVFTDEGWVAPRPRGGRDLYIFAYGHDYPAALRALYSVSGSQPVVPRWALGNWWSRYHRYTSGTYLELLDRFEAEGVRFSVAVLDMDWHRVDSVPPEHGSGWTGYSWERELFPDPEAFLAELHRRALRVTLNLHPADGVRSFEDGYAAMFEALASDRLLGDPIPFQITDPAFLDAYLRVLHHPLEAQGVDFWWMDWQQGENSHLAGIDPLWLLNHFHYLDSGRDGRRPLLLSRYAGPGSHRYPVGFSGDTIISWESLAFQPEFTATAANIGYGWWSHDIGGHLLGARDDELMVRWVQLGVYSPILRLHSSDNPFLAKEPWAYPAESRSAIVDALRERVRLVPYLHTMNHRANAEGVPLIVPLYHAWPECAESYEVPTQFLFGSELLVAPITSPRDPVTLMGSVTAWLPPGTWTDIHTGVVMQGDRSSELHRRGDSIPVLLRAGGIVPLAGREETDAASNPHRLDVLIAVGADGEFTLLEDDGGVDSATARTPIRWSQENGKLTIGPTQGDTSAVPRVRTWTVTFLGLGPDDVPGAENTSRGATVAVVGESGSPLTVTTTPDPRSCTRARVRATPACSTSSMPRNTATRTRNGPGGSQCRGVPPRRSSPNCTRCGCRRRSSAPSLNSCRPVDGARAPRPSRSGARAEGGFPYDHPRRAPLDGNRRAGGLHHREDARRYVGGGCPKIQSHGRQRREDQLSERQVVDTDDREVLRHAHAQAAARFEDGDRLEVSVRRHRRDARRGPRPGLDRALPVNRVEIDC